MPLGAARRRSKKSTGWHHLGFDQGFDPDFDRGFDSGFEPGFDPGFDSGFVLKKGHKKDDAHKYKTLPSRFM